MSEDDLPRTIIVLLAVFSVVSFAVGSALEIARPDVLLGHPYWVNLLSGMTGFTTSGFIISVLFRRIQRRHQRRAFAGQAGPEILRIAQEADACMWAMLSELDENAERGGIEQASAVVRAVRRRIDGVPSCTEYRGRGSNRSDGTPSCSAATNLREVGIVVATDERARRQPHGAGQAPA